MIWRVPQHLDRRTPIGFLTIPEWGIAALLSLVAFVWVEWLSPFDSFQSTVMGVVLIFAPLAAKAHLRGLYEVGLGYRLRGAVHMHRVQRDYRPGPSTRTGGYVLRDPHAQRPPRRSLRRHRGGREAGHGR
jgi:hypothetical protein